jgi:hypothetical protein
LKARIDRAHEEADRAAGRNITCPVLLLVSVDDDLDIHGDPRPSGGPGRPATYAAASFIPATTRPKKLKPGERECRPPGAG